MVYISSVDDIDTLSGDAVSKYTNINLVINAPGPVVVLCKDSSTSSRWQFFCDADNIMQKCNGI